VKLPVEGTMIHLRLHLPAGTALVRQLELSPATGNRVTLWKSSGTEAGADVRNGR
jgi:hypothetical protein